MGFQGKAQRVRRAVAVAAVMAVASTTAARALDAGSLLAPVLGPLSGAPGPVGAVAPFSAPGGGYAAFATGTVLHAGLAGAVAGLDFVSSTAAATSAPITSPTASELGRVALPVLPARGSYGQGTGLGLDVGLVPGLSTGLFGNAKAVAPPSTAPVEQQAAPISLASLVSLTPFRAGAQALSSAAGCVLGSNLASGSSEAADLTIAGQGGLHGLWIGTGPGAAGTGAGALSRSESRTAVVPGSVSGRLGLMAETSEALGPLTLLAGTAGPTTVELRGTWVLRVTADGLAGGVSYGPQGLAGDQVAVVVRNAAGAVVAQATAAQIELAGADGVGLAVAGVGEIVVGEQPRTRGRTVAPTALGTTTEAAVDLMRVRLLGQDIRLGHMEAAVAVPPAGITCPGLEVSVTPDAPTVAPGGRATVKVRVRNPNEGTTGPVTVVPRFGADPGVDYGVEHAVIGAGPTPAAAEADARRRAALLVGPMKFTTAPLGPGASAEFPLRLGVATTSGPGAIRIGATATGAYGDGPAAVATTGSVDGVGPQVTAVAPPAPAGTQNPVGGKAPATAGAPAPAGSGGRRPGRVSAGVTGAAGSAASAAPAAPAPTVSAPPPAPAVEPAPAASVPASEPVPAPAPVAPSGSPAPEQTAAPKPRPKGRSTERGRWAWGGAAAVFLVAIAAAAVARLLGGAARS